MNNIQVIGKFLDQPMLVSKLQRSVPLVLAGAVVGYTAVDVSNAPDRKKRKTAIKTGLTAGCAAASALLAPKIASKITGRTFLKSVEEIKKSNTELVDTFIKSNKAENNIKNILEKSKEKVLNRKEIKTLFETLSNNNKGNELLNKLVPLPKEASAKDIFSEIGYLSIYGAVPVIGGIIGGTAADKITDKKHWKEKIPDKIKEGSYQFLANIFMCNVGAGGALWGMEKAGIRSKMARAAGMSAGIIMTGIVGGSKIANMIGHKIIDPFCETFLHSKKCTKRDRTPEIIDVGLHTDDIATVSVLSGLKWIEPLLPLMYFISGERAGRGYRN